MTKQEKQMEIIKAIGRLSEDKIDYLYSFMQGLQSDKHDKTIVDKTIVDKNFINSNTLEASMRFVLEADSLEGINKDLAQFQNEMFNNNKGLKFEIIEYNVKKNERNSMYVYKAVIGIHVFLDSNTIKAMNEGKLIF